MSLPSQRLVLGTRASALALAQSQWVADRLQRAHPGLKVELRKITTQGDRIQDRPLHEVGGKGLFVKEIEAALLDRSIDFAVHSLKDMPAELPAGLALGAMPRREEPWDVLLSRESWDLSSLPHAAKVGTTSLRRRLQLARLRPDLRFEVLRGNIDTRVKFLKQGGFDAIVLAQAGMTRLGLSYPHLYQLSMVPAPGQGTLALEVREADALVRDALAVLHDDATERASEAERFVMRKMGGSCNLPFGAYGCFAEGNFRLRAFIAAPDGKKWIEGEKTGSAENSLAVAEELVEEFWRQGAQEIVEEISRIQ